MSDEKPLVSFCLKFFRQKNFCEAALNGAFAQTYHPLEIIVSDDGSCDGTAENVDEIIAKYKATIPVDRQHKVIALHNETNIGSAKTLEKQFKNANGELLFQADGDDISFPKRVEKVVDAWLASEKKAGLIIHGSIELYGNDRRSNSIRLGNITCIYGAVSAYTRSVIDGFSEIVYGNTIDDNIFSKRALLYGPVLHLPVPLIYYRIGYGITSWGNDYAKRRIKLCEVKLNGMPQVREDIIWSNNRGAMCRLNECRRFARQYAMITYSEYKSYVAGSLHARYLAWKVYNRIAGHKDFSVLALEHALLCLPTSFVRQMISRLFTFYWDMKHYFSSMRFSVEKESRSWVNNLKDNEIQIAN